MNLLIDAILSQHTTIGSGEITDKKEMKLMPH